VGGACVCQPECDGKECGDDGCGGTCGSCAGQDACVGGLCVCQAACGEDSSVEMLGRGLVALPKDAGVYMGWRLLPWDDPTVGFNVYRGTSAMGIFTKVNSSPIVSSTNYQDGSAQAGTTYYYLVRTVDGAGVEGPNSNLSKVQAGATSNSIDIQMSSNADCPAGLNWYTGSWGGVTPGDINGDGVLDFVMMMFDWDNSSQPYCLEAFISADGGWESKWRISTGNPSNKDSGIVLWDLDGDGHAEIIARTGPDGDLSVLDPETGAVVDSTPWPYSAGALEYGNFVFAYLEDLDLDGLPEPFILTQNGMYLEPAQNPRFAAFTYDPSGGFVKRRDVTFSSDGIDADHPATIAMGTHGFFVADLTGDGLDNVMPCGSVLYPDWDGYWVIAATHSDVCHAGDVDPAVPGVELLVGSDDGEGSLTSFSSGAPVKLWSVDAQHVSGWDKGWCADISAGYAGMECAMMDHDEDNYPIVIETRLFTSGGLEITGEIGLAMQYESPADWAGGEGLKDVYMSNCGPTNPTSCMAGQVADVVGDSREEVLAPDFEADVMRIYTNIQISGSRQVTPLADRGYRAVVARMGCYSYNKVAVKTNQPRFDMVPSAGAMVSTCEGKPAGHVCRPANGACDVAETCDGVLSYCPADAFASAGMVCQPSTNACDPAEVCDGVSPNCPQDINNCLSCVVGSCSDTIDGGGTIYALAGKVFISTNCQQAAPTAAVYCGTASSCADGDCTGMQYYRACDGSGACRTNNDGAGTQPIFAESCKVLNSSCASVSPGLGLYCDAEAIPIDDCECQIYFRGCTGSGSCYTDNTCAWEHVTPAPTGKKFIAGCYLEDGDCP